VAAPLTRILAAVSPGEVRIAVLEGEEMAEYAIWRPGAPDGLGDMHVGRITARVPAMAGAFVALADAEGFLPDSAGAAGRGEGDHLAVRVTRTAQGGKGPRLAAVPDVPAGGPVRLLHRGADPLQRLAEAYPAAPILIDDSGLLGTLRGTHGPRLHPVAAAFDDGLETVIDGLGEQAISLPGGLSATVVPTPALVAIDVDGGGMTSARGPKQAVQMQANRAAIPALARQIRLRNLSGAILIDFAGLSVRKRAALAPDLALALAADAAKPAFLGFSRLGLAEIARPRRGPPLHELLSGAHAAGLTALRAAVRSLDRQPPPRLALRGHPAVINALRADQQALADLARRAVHPLILRADPALPPEGWTIEECA
jgi:hypothetical protein